MRYYIFQVRMSLLKILKYLFEFFGISIFSKPGFNGLDNKLEKYLDFSNGFFIEVGANDGFLQSNTYYLEKFKNWSGVLVEAIPDLYKKCTNQRDNSKVYNYALGNWK